MLSEIIAGMQFSFLGDKTPLNTTGAARYAFSYQFATFEPVDFVDPGEYTGWTAFTETEKAAIRAAMAHIETFLNIDFVEVTGSADPDLNLGKVDLPGVTAGVGGPSISFSGATIMGYDAYVVYDNTIDLSSGEVDLILHELGHALGLKHPFNAPLVPAGTDNNKYTIMSYTSNPDNARDAEVMMHYDILALQDLWGAAAHNEDDTIYTGPRGVAVDAVWDSGGVDTFSAAGRTNAVTLDLREGAFSRFGAIDNVVIAYGVGIENAVGGRGNDRLVGNDLGNVLKGVLGADTILAGAGADVVRGGVGRDLLRGQGGNDRLNGDGGNDRMLGDAGRDVLLGAAGNDRLNGGKGNDTMTGGAGADIFQFRAGGGRDKITDFRNDTDTLKFIGLGTLAEVQGAAAKVGADVVFTFDTGDTLTLLDARLGQVLDDILV